MFLQVEDGLFYKLQKERLMVGGTGRAGECRRHICSCHSLGGLGAWEPSAAPVFATGFLQSAVHLSI